MTHRAAASAVGPAAVASRHRVRSALAYLLLAHGLSWGFWIPAIRLGASEELLTLGAAGPAVAALLLSFRGERVEGQRAWPRVVWFVVFLAVSWGVLVLSAEWRGGWRWPVEARPLLIVPALVPAWILSGSFSRDRGVRELLSGLLRASSWQWPTIALVSMPALLLIPAAAVHLLGGSLVMPPSSGTVLTTAATGTVALSRALLFTAVLEEPGWRGYLLEQLQPRLSPLTASLFVWFPWALWHAPLDFSGGVGASLAFYVEVRVVFFVAITILMTWLYNRSGQNLMTVVLFHAGVNTFPFVLPYAPSMLSLIFVWVGCVVVMDKMWRRRPEAARTPLPNT